MMNRIKTYDGFTFKEISEYFNAVIKSRHTDKTIESFRYRKGDIEIQINSDGTWYLDGAPDWDGSS